MGTILLIVALSSLGPRSEWVGQDRLIYAILAECRLILSRVPADDSSLSRRMISARNSSTVTSSRAHSALFWSPASFAALECAC